MLGLWFKVRECILAVVLVDRQATKVAMSYVDAQCHAHCRNAKWRERRSRVDKDVRRTDRQQPFYSESRSSNIKQLRNILLTYVQYNNDLGYCQVRCLSSMTVASSATGVSGVWASDIVVFSTSSWY